MSLSSTKFLLITGAAGFIGSHLVRGALERGWSIRAVDDLSSGKLENLADVLDSIEFLEGDISNEMFCHRALQGIDAVSHQAAVASVPRSFREPLQAHRATLDSTLQLLVGCERNSVRRMVLASSAAIYGKHAPLPNQEEMPPDPISPYALQKWSSERYGQLYGAEFGIKFAALRYFNVYGPRQDPAGDYAAVIPKFITRMLQGQRPIIYGDGQTSRDFVFVEDIVRANLLALEHPRLDDQPFNIASGQAISLLDLVATINQCLGTSLEPIFQPERIGDIQSSVGDPTRAQKVLGFQPRISLQEGLEKTIQSFAKSQG